MANLDEFKEAILENIEALSEGLVAITGLAVDNEAACEVVCELNTSKLQAVLTFLDGQRRPDYAKAVEDIHTATAQLEEALTAILEA